MHAHGNSARPLAAPVTDSRICQSNTRELRRTQMDEIFGTLFSCVGLLCSCFDAVRHTSSLVARLSCVLAAAVRGGNPQTPNCHCLAWSDFGAVSAGTMLGKLEQAMDMLIQADHPFHAINCMTDYFDCRLPQAASSVRTVMQPACAGLCRSLSESCSQPVHGPMLLSSDCFISTYTHNTSIMDCCMPTNAY